MKEMYESGWYDGYRHGARHFAGLTIFALCVGLSVGILLGTIF